MKIVLNKCYGGFGLSRAAFERLIELGNAAAIKYRDKWISYGYSLDKLYEYAGINPDIERHDPQLVQVVEELGERASGDLAELEIAYVPDGERYEIDDYDGIETVGPPRTIWG